MPNITPEVREQDAQLAELLIDTVVITRRGNAQTLLRLAALSRGVVELEKAWARLDATGGEAWEMDESAASFDDDIRERFAAERALFAAVRKYVGGGE